MLPLSVSTTSPETLRWRRLAGLVTLVVIAVLAIQTEPRPGLHGVGLVVLLAMIGLVGGGLTLLFTMPRKWLAIALFVVIMAASAILVYVEPNGAGFFGAFVVAGVASSRMSGRTGLIVVTVSLVVLAIAGIIGAQRPLLSTLLIELGVVAFYRLGLYARKLKERTEESEQLLAELQRTREAQLHAAASEERQRLAREMHDVLAHSLSGLLLHLEAARLLAVRDEVEPRLTDTLERAHHLAKSGLGEARQAIGMLRDEELPGPERLPALAEEFNKDVSCEFTISGDSVELGAETRLTIYRVAQEALTNIRRHSNARQVIMRLEYAEDDVLLSVRDIGETIKPEGDSGYGITGMRERAELLGGSLSAEPTETGFLVSLRVPR